MQEKLELLKDVKISIKEIDDDKGIDHNKVKEMILNRIICNIKK